jgi:hypothetical protein
MKESRQSRGIGSFFFAAIFWVIAFGAVTFLSFITGIVEFKHTEATYTKQQTYEGRREERVGVNGEILKPVEVVFTGHGCVKIDRAYLDTQTLTTYISNTCGVSRKFVAVYVKEYAPDGTIVHSNYQFLQGEDNGIAAGERVEVTTETSEDTRVVKIVVSTDGGRAE